MKANENKKENERTNVQNEKVQVTNEAQANVQAQANEQAQETENVVIIDTEQVQKVRKTIANDYKCFIRTLEANLYVLEKQYEEYESTKEAFNKLATFTRTNVQDFFNVDFVKKLYKTYTFTDVNGENYTCIAETRKKTEKTNFENLEERVFNVLGEALNIKATYNEKENTYYFPILNFSVSNITKYLLTIDSYVVELAKYKKQKQAEARKAKKQAKKQAKQANTEQVSTEQVQAVANVA